MFYYNGVKYYHPVQLAQRILLFDRSFKANGDSTFIFEGAKYIEKLMEIGMYYDDAIFFPYTFDILPHGGYGENNTIELMNPWFSGMAQGRVLSVLVRWYKFTHDPKYLEYAKYVFNSFFKVKGSHEPWVTLIDENNNFWIEEYPFDEPSHVLNGFVFAIYGLYEYYLLDPSDEIRVTTLRAAITTIEMNIHKYRRPGERSLYCLKHNFQASVSYHMIHIEQLDFLYRISGSVYLKGMSALFAEDAP